LTAKIYIKINTNTLGISTSSPNLNGRKIFRARVRSSQQIAQHAKIIAGILQQLEQSSR